MEVRHQGFEVEAFFNPLTIATLTLILACALLHYCVARDAIFWILKWLFGSIFARLHFYVTPFFVFARLLLGPLLFCAASHGCMHDPSELLRVSTKDAKCSTEGDKEMITRQLQVCACLTLDLTLPPLDIWETRVGQWRIRGT